ncbi:MAG: hypothetical protein NT040_02040 [Bacteroidetes bacterium]|nr:hypothetical protein [Bacteroidota bacterium]
MNVFKMNRRSILARTLWLLLFVALGCSQRSCSCKRVEPIRQEIVIADRIGEKTKDKYPAAFVEMLFIKDADTLPPGFKPVVLLKRLDTGKEISNVQNTGLNGWQSFIRNIFPLSPDNYDPDLDRRFLTNEPGKELTAKSPVSDSLKIVLLNKYLLKELQEPGKCKLFFYSANASNKYYRCIIDISDTAVKVPPGAAHQKPPVKKTGKGFGCAGAEPISGKTRDVRKALDTVFQVINNIDSINFLIAKTADSVLQNKSGCSVRDHNLKYIIVYEPPAKGNDTSINFINARVADTIRNTVSKKPIGPLLTNVTADSIKPGCKFILQPSTARIKFGNGTIGNTTSQPLVTYPGSADSIVWELSKCSPGLTVSMPGNKVHGTGEIPSFEVTRGQKLKKGTVSFKVIVYKSGCVPARMQAGTGFVYQFSLDTAFSAPCSKSDTAVINQLRRQIINDFRDLLFMYANTESAREQDFFRNSAMNKIREIPDVKVEIIPQTDIFELFKAAAPAEEEWLFTPLLDKRKCLIVGVTIRRKKT